MAVSNMSDPKPPHPNEQEWRPIILQQQVAFEPWQAETKSDHILGYIRVSNRAYEKRVFVRYTRNYWETFLEVEAYWVETVDKKTDKFIFVIPFPSDWSGTVEFAIRYEVRGVEYWDSNKEKNYSIAVKQPVTKKE